MEFKDKYCVESEAELLENKLKIPLTNEAFAIAEAVDNLIKKIEHLRISK